MIFKQVDEIIGGKKTQTRRVVKAGEVYVPGLRATQNGRVKWRCGGEYAVVPRRGGKTVHVNSDLSWSEGPNHSDGTPLRIRITDIRQERLQAISEADACAEGVEGVEAYRALWERINGAGSWEKNPLVWVLTFERVNARTSND